MKASIILVNTITLCFVSAFSLSSPTHLIKSTLRINAKTPSMVNPNEKSAQAKEAPKTKEELLERYLAVKTEDIILGIAISKNPEFAKVVIEDVKSQIMYALGKAAGEAINQDTNKSETK